MPPRTAFTKGDPRAREAGRKGGAAKNRTPTVKVLQKVGSILAEMSGEAVTDQNGKIITKNEVAAAAIYNNALKDARWMELYLRLTDQMPAEQREVTVKDYAMPDALKRQIDEIKRAHHESA